MSINVGSLDRIFRVILGVVLIALPFLSGWAFFDATWATGLSIIVGLVMLGTAAMSTCPIYSIFGIRTCRR